MYRKLDDEAIGTLLETGIDEFAEHGLDRANINTIAKKAGVSVGVIYKYYTDKDQFFLACVRHALKALDSALEKIASGDEDVRTSLRLLVHDMLETAEEHRSYFIMYNEVTSGSCRKYAGELAQEIETDSAKVYSALISKAQAEGKMQTPGDPRMFAFFLDNLLMMLHFSYGCEYYRERMKIFLGEDISGRKEEVEDAFVDFLTHALGVE